MPIYEYECENCHEITEAWQHLADEPLTSCPKCSGALKKLISRSSFQLKGGGWYADGYCSTSNTSGKDTKKSDSTAAPAAPATPAPSCPKSDGNSCCSCPASST
ncbi:MAG TPA: zinc ribbon domain-containing protein [Desulfobacterales bacterium]|nr:zinc ribbon domain-containing protein [Desulfobacterales bacterium]